MKGRLVELTPLTGADYDLIAGWSSPMAGFRSFPTGAGQFASADAIRQAAPGGDSQCLMVRTLDGRRIGIVHWSPLGGPNCYQAGVGIGESDLWQRGFGGDALNLMLDYLFHMRNAHRVQFTVGLHNRHSLLMLNRGLLTIEGVLRDYLFVDGAYHDAIIFSVLRREFYALCEQTGVPPVQTVSQDDMAEARRLFRKYVTEHGHEILAQLVDHRALT